MSNKRIVFYVTGQYMRQNKRSTITTAVGIFFMVMMMTCVFVGKDTAIRYLTQTAEGKSGSWHLSVYDVNEEQYDRIRGLDFVKETAVSVDQGFTDCEASANDDKPYLEIKGYSADCFDWMNIRLTEGRYPENENELIVSQNLLEDGGSLQVGDTLPAEFFYRSIRGINPDLSETHFPFQQIQVKYGETVDVPQDFPYFGINDSFEELHTMTGESTEYVVVGFFRAPPYEMEDGSFYAALSCIPNSFGNREKVNLTCKYDLGRFHDSDIQTIYEIMGSYDNIESNDLVLAFSGDTADSDTNVLANVLVAFFVLFILLVSVILIYNVFNISFEERQKYLGMLASVGATRRQKCSSVYYEAFTLLLFALPMGILVGLGIVKAGMLMLQPHILGLMDSFVAETVNHDTVRLAITPWNLLLVIAASVLTVFISSLLPARRIGKIGPIESIRGNDKGKDRQYGSSPFLMKSGRAELLMAVRNLLRQRKKTGSIIRAVAVFLLVLTVTTYGTSAVTQMVHYRLVEDVTVGYNLKGYDYVLSEASGYGKTYGMLRDEIVKDPDVVETKEWYDGMFISGSFDGRILNEEYWDAYREIIRAYYGSELSDAECMEHIIADMDGRIYETLNVAAVDAKSFADIAGKCGCDSTLLANSKCPAILYRNVTLSTDNIGFEGMKAKHYRLFELSSICDVEPGGSFPISLYNAGKQESVTLPLTLIGYADREDIAEYLTFNGEQIWLIVSVDTGDVMNEILAAEGMDEDGNYSAMSRQLYIKVSDADCALAKRLDDLSGEGNGEYYLASGQVGVDYETIAEAISYAVQILAAGFVVLSSLICLVNLYNSIRGRAVTRRRDIAMLRSVGMEERQLNRMLLFENAGIWASGLLWAILCSLPITHGIDWLLKGYFGVMQIRFPWMLDLLAAFVTIISLLILTKVCYHMGEDEILLEEMRV